MSLHLLSVTSDKATKDPDNDTASNPREWRAVYHVRHETGPEYAPATRGVIFWNEVEVAHANGEYQARIEIKAPAKPTMREALMKLAEWAQFTANGITETDLTEHGFPLEMMKRTEAIASEEAKVRT